MGPRTYKFRVLFINSEIHGTSTRGGFLRESAHILDRWYSVSIQEP
jgi:hypothetical protein